MVDAASGTSRVVPLGGGINFRDLGGYLNEDGRRLNGVRFCVVVI